MSANPWQQVDATGSPEQQRIRDSLTTDCEPKCWRCGRVLARALSRPWWQNCHGCKARNGSPPYCPRCDEPQPMCAG